MTTESQKFVDSLLGTTKDSTPQVNELHLEHEHMVFILKAVKSVKRAMEQTTERIYNSHSSFEGAMLGLILLAELEMASTVEGLLEAALAGKPSDPSPSQGSD